ncbi:tRNA (guanine(10)-N(2))-dimethyltransferase [Candidatus Micrarchaeota archaeon]|nr:tRNA (guanine(10)-N(2))-dimethyltransferase [Candidatus Micrarchaeota archaeon]
MPKLVMGIGKMVKGMKTIVRKKTAKGGSAKAPAPGFSSIVEESAHLLVPAGSESDAFHKDVFYNPAMRLNRSLSSLALGAFIREGLLEKPAVLDGLAATGARGIRYALENETGKVVFVDANPAAIPVLKKNIAKNKLAGKAKAVGDDLNAFLCKSWEKFDFVELDPFGSPVFFLNNAIRCVSQKGILSVTATDLAKLCGKEQATCIRHYSSKPMRCPFSHELALRILIKKVVEAAAVHDVAAVPLFSFYHGHALKAFFTCERRPQEASGLLGQIAFAVLCRKCFHRGIEKFPPGKCPNCGAKTDCAGPLWAGETTRVGLSAKLIELNRKRNYADSKAIGKILEAINGENGLLPLFYDLHELSEKLSNHSPKTSEFVKKLRDAGFEAGATHYSPTGVKTNAPIGEMERLLAK